MIVGDDRFLPVRIFEGALGHRLPTSDLLVSRQHPVVARSPITERMFGLNEILLAAIRLTDLPDIYFDTSVRNIEYIHFLLDDHAIVFAEDAPKPGQPAKYPLAKSKFVSRIIKNDRPLLEGVHPAE